MVVVSLKSSGWGIVKSLSYFVGIRYKLAAYPLAFLQWYTTLSSAFYFGSIMIWFLYGINNEFEKF